MTSKDDDVDTDDENYNPDDEFDIDSYDGVERLVYDRIRSKRDSFYSDIPQYISTSDRRRLSDREMREWARVLDKYIVDKGLEDYIVVFTSDMTGIDPAFRVSRTIMIFHFNLKNHFLVIDFNRDWDTICVYDSSGFIIPEKDMWKAFELELNASWLRYIKTCFNPGTTKVVFSPMWNYNSGDYVGYGQCGAFSAWTALYLVLNPEKTSVTPVIRTPLGIPITNTNVPPLPGHDAVAFYRYIRVCIKERRLILPSSFKVYVGFGKRKSKKTKLTKENKDFLNFVKFLKAFPKKIKHF